MQNMPKTILILDDDKEIRDLFLAVIDPAVAVLAFAGSVAEAKILIEMQHVDVMFLDLFLPDGDGLSVLDYWEKIHDSCEPPCTIIMSAYGNWKNYLSAFNHRAFYFLEKPFKLTRIRFLVDEALRKADSRIKESL